MHVILTGVEPVCGHSSFKMCSDTNKHHSSSVDRALPYVPVGDFRHEASAFSATLAGSYPRPVVQSDLYLAPSSTSKLNELYQ
jgi:hypothetical protein